MVHTDSSGSRKKKRKSVTGKEKDSLETNSNKHNKKDQKSASKGKKNKQQSQKKENPLEKLPFELVSEVSSLSLFLFD